MSLGKSLQKLRMKKYLKIAFVCCSIGVTTLGCTEKEISNVPQAPVVVTEQFAARYCVPLTKGRENGENQVVDPNHALATNVAELKPAIAKVIQDAMDARIESHPDEGKDKEMDPKTFLQRVISRMSADGRPKPALADMTVSLEVNYDGRAANGHSQLTPASLDLIWVDPAGELPDYLLCRIFVKDLKGYEVQAGGKSVSLETYLQAMSFEAYPINVSVGEDIHRIKSFSEARDMQQLIEQGNLAAIMNP